VPEGFRPALTEADILSYRVLLLEREGRGFRSASSYPARAVTCATTHDLPPLAGWWDGSDIRERATLGLLHDLGGAEDERKLARVALTDALVADGCLPPPVSAGAPIASVIEGAHKFVASTPCDLMLVQAEDLAGMRVGVNLPGTDTERPNWRIRLPVPVEELLTGETAQMILRAVHGANRGTVGPGDETGNPVAHGQG
jgi:4-alpha-glucanotransferase